MRLPPSALVLAALAASRLAFAAPPSPAPIALAALPPVPTAATSPPATAPEPPAAAPPDSPAPAPSTTATEAPAPDPLAALRAPPGRSYQLVGSLFFGDGLRFNNPYRLHTQLGESAKTVSVTAPYIDLGIALGIGDALGLRHGASLNLTAALSGINQAVLAPTYFASYRGLSHRFMGFGRLGPVFILSPDPNAGAELAAGGAVFVTAKTAVSAEIVADLFYGAATREAGYPVYPVVSLQLGLLVDHEVLP